MGLRAAIAIALLMTFAFVMGAFLAGPMEYQAFRLSRRFTCVQPALAVGARTAYKIYPDRFYTEEGMTVCSYRDRQHFYLVKIIDYLNRLADETGTIAKVSLLKAPDAE